MSGVHMEEKRSSSESSERNNDDDGGVQDFADPAILVMGNVPPVGEPITPEFRYSKDDLLKLRKAPGSLKRPEFLDANYYNNNGVWDPEPWHYSHKANDTTAPPVENGGNGGGGGTRPNNEPNEGHKQRRPGDPRERIRKEQDGIVLSPQRRSFNSGCFVPVREPLRPARAHSPIGGKGEPAHITHRDINTGPPARRIGSGRILPWDFQEKSDVDNDFGYRRDRDRRDTDRERDRDDRFDRRSFSREFDVNKEREREKDRHIGRNNNNNNARYSNRRISNESREEEPEWLSFGPMSQNDTIELRGFDESEKLGNKKKGSAQKKNKKEQQQGSGAQQSKSKESDKIAEEGAKQQQVAKRSSPTPQDGGGVTVTAAAAKPMTTRSSPIAEKKETGGGDGPHVSNATSSVDDNSFNFEDILKCDTIPGISGLLSNGVESGDAAGSRFSRWFKREKSPPSVKKPDTAGGSRRSSLQDQDHHQIIKNLLGDSFNEPSVNIPQPGDSESYFAPISPAASSILPQQQPQQQQQQHQGKPMNLIDMLQRSNKLNRGGGTMPPHMHSEPPPMKGLGDVPGKILSLEELEATMMQGMDGPNNKHTNKNEDELNAFKRLLTQAGSGMNHHMNNGPILQKPMSIMEMLSHSQQQDEAARLANQRIPGNLPTPLLNDMSYKLQQVQNHVQQQQKLEMFNKLMNATLAQQQTRASPLPPDMGVNHRELLQRPEAQAILQGLKRGDITPQHLYQQLANPAMQPRHRDLLVTILKMQVTGGMSQSATSPVQPPPPSGPHHMFQQQLRVSPLPNAYCVSPILATSPNTLSVPAMHQRIPSPRELQMHTQSIMQRALIKKKLEEQEENYRKKQAQQRGTSPAKTASPTPLAFTPTAVLRKMTADKDDASKENKGDKLPQGRPLTGMRAPQQPPQQQPQQLTSQQQQPPNWNNQFSQQLKQPGRPIVKANNNYQQQQQPAQHTQQEQFFQQQRLLQVQQQQRKSQQTFNANYPNQNQQQFPQLTQQQLRAQHQNVRAQHQHQQQQQYGGGQSQQQQSSWTQQMLQGQGFGDNRQVGRGGIDGDLSPTSNQLARWFSPDLLDRARKGKLPVIPPNAMPQALSLEEVERQTTPVGHN